MRTAIFMLLCTLAASGASSAEDTRAFAFSLGGFSGHDTSGVAIGVYMLRPGKLGWYVNGTLASSADVDEDPDFRPIPGDIRVDGETESATLNLGLTWTLGPVTPYAGVGLSIISEYGLYRAPSAAFWYEEKDETEANLNLGVLIRVTDRLGVDLGANTSNDELVAGLNWTFR